MCELLAICSNISTSPVISFKKILMRSGENPDGWGIGFYVNGKAEIFKEPVPAYESDIARKIENGIIEVRSKLIIAHIRDASVGSRKMENTHPFLRQLFGREWIFAHNGTVGKRDPPRGIFLQRTGKFKAEGETDSERAFCYMMNKISEKSQFSEIRDAVKESADYIKRFGRFNFILSDSKHLYCHGDDSLWFLKREFGAREVTLEDSDYRIRVSDARQKDEKAIIVATKPLSNGKWVRIEGMKVFRSGAELL